MQGGFDSAGRRKDEQSNVDRSTMMQKVRWPGRRPITFFVEFDMRGVRWEGGYDRVAAGELTINPQLMKVSDAE